MKHLDNQIYLIHGYTATPNSNWFPWINNQMKRNFSTPVNMLEMPNTDQPRVNEWDQKADEVIKPSNHMTIIGHSLGCIEALRFVSQHQISNVNLVLVSGFDETTHTLPQLHEFTDSSLDINNDILPKIKNAVVISAVDDDIVPSHYSQKLSEHLKCKFILLPNGKHFIDRDQIFELPSVYEELQNMLSQN